MVPVCSVDSFLVRCPDPGSDPGREQRGHSLCPFEQAPGSSSPGDKRVVVTSTLVRKNSTLGWPLASLLRRVEREIRGRGETGKGQKVEKIRVKPLGMLVTLDQENQQPYPMPVPAHLSQQGPTNSRGN